MNRLALIALAFSAACRATTPAPEAAPATATVAHDSLIVASQALGEPRRVNVHVPAGYSRTSARFPVLYMPDGGMDEDFPHIVAAVDSLVAARAISPMLVVGIPNTERRRDLTGPTRVASDSAIAPHVGGSAAFRRFIRDELIPTIDARYRTTNERAIIGESLAGLFIVETLLREPTLFDQYIAFDPSLWWNRGALVDSATMFARGIPASAHRRTLFVASSGDDIDDWAARFADALRAAAPAGLVWTYSQRRDLTHATIFRALEVQGLVSALSWWGR